MATDFSISTLLNLPTMESRNGPRQKKEVELPIPERICSHIDEMERNGNHTRHVRRNSHSKETQKSSSTTDLTRFPAGDYTTIVIPKKHAKPRRKRTAFSNIQLHFLEQFFQKKAYPSSQERNFIASILNIGSGQVKTWYQNRRTKMKKNKVFDFGVNAQEPSVSSTIESTFDLGKNYLHTKPLASSAGESGTLDMHCDWCQPTCIGSNLVLQQQSMQRWNRLLSCD